jgi:group II intron reverse transcriptase/maturase
MQKADQILQAIRKLGQNKAPLTRVYRCLYSEDLYLAAYAKIYSNQGAMTPGSDKADTVDGMSLNRIRKIIEELRYERYHFKPVRRTRIPKKSGRGTRNLGVPNFTDKLLQEVLRMILEAYYEPHFRESSHGYRPERGCHTALQRIKQSFRASAWLIEGDIKGCFDNINHDVLLNILKRDIHDGRLIDLIEMSLKAGVMDGWQYHRTYSGTPQGGVLSPLLSNIYLNELDSYIEDVLIPQYTRGKKRQMNREYMRIQGAIQYARKMDRPERVKTLVKQIRTIPSVNTHDPNFRRLRYVRYADDFILGFIGSKSEAEAIKAAIRQFLQEHLQLTLSDEKTLITHARTQHAHFLGYAVSIYQSNDKITRDVKRPKVKKRSVNGHVRLGIPYNLPQQVASRYMKNGKPISEAGLLYHSDAHIIDVYQAQYRGLTEYYKFATDRYRLNYVRHIMEISLVKTLAHKLKTTVKKIYRKYRTNRMVDGLQYKVLRVDVPTKKGTRSIYWGGIPLRTVKACTGELDDNRYVSYEYRSDLIQRLKANECELCGSTKDCEVHHIKKLKDLKRRWAGRKTKPQWVTRMIAMNRKTLVVCHDCHRKIHTGQPIPTNNE